MFCCTRWIAKGEKFINLVISHTILSVATTWVWEIRIDRTQFSQWMCDIGLNVKGSVHYYYSPCVSNVITLNNYFLHTSERVTLPKTQGENFIRWSPCLGYWTSVRYCVTRAPLLYFVRSWVALSSLCEWVSQSVCQASVTPVQISTFCNI